MSEKLKAKYLAWFDSKAVCPMLGVRKWKGLPVTQMMRLRRMYLIRYINNQFKEIK